MEDTERLGGALQENILCLLCFDEKHYKLVRAAVSPQMFESKPFKELAGIAIDFIDQFGTPIQEHIADQIEHILNGDDERKASVYARLLENLYLAKESVNGEYVMSQLHKFVRQQNMKSALVEAVEAIKDGRIDDAEVALEKGLKKQIVAFEAGLSLSDASDIEAILDTPEEEGFELGIPQLDESGIIPRRKELYMMMAARGRGKSWFINHCAKQALLQRWRVLIITLEMSERNYAVRFLQSFFSISKREARAKITRLVKTRDGDLDDLITEEVIRPTLKDDNIKSYLSKKAKREFGRRKNYLRIKAFPTKTLTMPQLNAYLDGLERYEKFTPDAILVDYPDLFKLDNKNARLDLGDIVGGLRGVAGERNAAMIAVTQPNREGEKATTLTADMAAEDISKLAHADNFLTYSQTKMEYILGLARIGVEKARNEKKGFSLLIAQAYDIGQFCLDSVKLAYNYWEMMTDKGEEKESGGRRRRRRRDEEEDEDER